METIICKECGEELTYKKIGACHNALNRHLKKKHKMTKEEYVVKHEYGGIHPKCPCGCGFNLALKPGSWVFNTYYSDTCYSRMLKNDNKILDEHIASTKKVFDIVKYYEMHYDRKSFEEAFELFKTKEYTLTDVSKTYQIDKRTLKKVWLALKITNPEELTELTEYAKYKMPVLTKSTSTFNDDEIMAWCYNLIKTYPCKYTIHSLNKAYNNAHKDKKTRHSGETIAKSLYKIYGDEIDLYLAKGIHSSEEYKFYEILRFYMPGIEIKLGKKFILYDGYVFFDIMVGNKILIEYNSDGFFHNHERAKKNDKKKEEFAKENDYIFFCLSKTDIQDINTLIKIKNIVENEVNRNNNNNQS